MADATMERSLAAAIESSVAATATAAGTLYPYLVGPATPVPAPHHRFQEQEPAAQLPDDDDDEGQITGGDVVASLLDEFSPRDSDLDERILECPMIDQLLLLAMASLQQEVIDLQIVSQLGEAYRNGGFGAVPAAAAAVANLGKQTFRAAGGDDGTAADHHRSWGITRTCSVCLEDFSDGDEISVMPCSGGHEFHTSCITKWLGCYSNMCPLCRHALATDVDGR